MPPIESFSKEYREACFYSWYSAGCPTVIKNSVPADTDGRTPSNNTLKRWSIDDGWRQRAEALDGEISLAVDRDIIERKKQDYIELSETGRELIKGGSDYLKEKGYDSASAAVRAIGLGADMVAKYSRAAEMIESVVGKTDRQIGREIERLLGKEVEEDVEIIEEVDSADSDEEEDDNS
jgi:hypothetical protein